METNRATRRNGFRSAHPSLLTRLVYDDRGERLVPTHARKGHLRYRYYVSKPLQLGGARREGEGRRIPVIELERIVSDRVRQFLARPTEIFAAIQSITPDGALQQRALARAEHSAQTWPEPASPTHRDTLRGWINRVLVGPEAVIIHLSGAGLAQQLDLKFPINGPEDETPEALILSAPVQVRRWRKEVRLLVQGAAGNTEPNPTLTSLILRAHRLWVTLLAEPQTMTSLAKREGVTASYLTRLIRLAWLAPDITAAILEGTQPASLTANRLLLEGCLPLAWSEQHTRLGFSPWKARSTPSDTLPMLRRHPLSLPVPQRVLPKPPHRATRGKRPVLPA